MDCTPRKKSESLFTWNELGGSILKGMAITSVLLLLLFLMMTNGYEEDETRTVVFIALVISNILLTFTGRSETESIFKTIRYRNTLIPIMTAVTVLLLLAIVYWPDVASVFGFIQPSGFNWLSGIATAMVAVLWIEIYKSLRRDRSYH